MVGGLHYNDLGSGREDGLMISADSGDRVEVENPDQRADVLTYNLTYVASWVWLM